MKNILLTLILTFLLFSCKNETISIGKDSNLSYYEIDTTVIQDGGVKMIPITTKDTTFHIWTKRIGNNPKTKVLLLNGGPGCTHEYFECFENFLPAEGIEFIYYDQLGCGNSDNPKDTTFWDLSRYVEEVEQVRKALHLNKDNFYVLGHSWGGILAMEYALKYQQEMKGLIISNMMSSCPEYGKYADEVLALQMKPDALYEIQKIEAEKDFSNPKYMELLLPNFYEQHILRLPAKDWPEPVNRSFAKMNQSLYVTMQGPSEFGISGKLEKWDRTNDLRKITLPTLVIGAQFDTMDPKFMEKMSKLIPKGNYLYCEKGSHMAFYDDQQTYFKGLISFLKK
ncbi:Proline iminopeptidase [Flavobacterium sp. 9AF]|uniref:proline iminopeptidase-family hydrolase n=1 Tax=Flavobacterium sp. 9AF TaxID=2653142 RepID=UPI0012F1FB71|nr:proline iminopeptidase-family hydrolase [Flavobacterium sp. 9AF]VXC33438.1 Proline iminopeptidase [Flavobacterium sp. 9AF]